MLKKKLFASWDQFMVPYPFSRGAFCWGAPLWVSRESDDTALETMRQQLEAALNCVTMEADQSVAL
jgi:lysophospholipid acyltransferase (LPLAT)-like uncharacterized protein